MGRVEYWNDPAHIVAYSDGEIRQEWELIFLGRPVSGMPTVNDEASDVRWVASGVDGPLQGGPRRHADRAACGAAR